MQVRKATDKDLQYLIQFTFEEAREAEELTISTEILEKGINEALKDPNKSMYWVLVDALDIPVGSISALKEWSDWRAGYFWWIQSLYIQPDHRGKGHFRLLLDKVLAEMKNMNGVELRLYVHKKNHAAIKAYEKAGFSPSDYQIMILKA